MEEPLDAGLHGMAAESSDSTVHDKETGISRARQEAVDDDPGVLTFEAESNTTGGGATVPMDEEL